MYYGTVLCRCVTYVLEVQKSYGYLWESSNAGADAAERCGTVVLVRNR